MQILGTIDSSKQVVYISAMDSISTTTLAATSTTVIFSSIPQTYDHLQLRIFARSDGAGASSALIEVNSDATTSNYRNIASEAVLGVNFSRTQGDIPPGLNVAGTESNSLYYSTSITDIYDYSITSKYNPTYYSRASYDRTTTTIGSAIAKAQAAIWKTGFQGITTITIRAGLGNFVAGSTFALYGINLR